VDYFFRSLILFLLLTTNSIAAPWVQTWHDGPASATYERTPTAMRVFVDVPSASGHAQYTLNSNPPKAWTPTPSSTPSSFGPASTATIPKIAAIVKIPLGLAAGGAAVATLTAVIPKAALARAATALVRANPYIATGLTVAWLANAGVQYFKDTDSFTSTPVIHPGALQQCTDVGTSVGSTAYYGTTRYTIVNAGTSGFTGCTSPSTFVMSCTGSPFSPNSPAPYWPQLCQYINAPIVPSPIIESAVQTKLQNTPVSGTADTAAGLDGVLGETVQNGFNPDTDGATPHLEGSTAPIQGPKQTTTSPDGTVTTTNTTYTPSYTNNYGDITQNTVTTNTTIGGTTTTTTTETQPDIPAIPEDTQPQEEPKTDCDKFPDNIGCSKYGAIPGAETIPVIDAPVSLSYTSWGSGSCPASVVIGHGVMFSYQFMCDKLMLIKPILIACALLASLFIISGAVKD
jgi:hypothetical protein